MTITNGVRIRQFYPTDREQVVNLLTDAYGGGAAPRRFQPLALNSMLNIALSGHSAAPRVLVGVHGTDKQIIAVGAYAPGFFSGFAWELGYGAVRKDHQGRGLGAQMIHARLEMIRGESGPEDFIVVRTTRWRLFARLGFRPLTDDRTIWKGAAQ